MIITCLLDHAGPHRESWRKPVSPHRRVQCPYYGLHCQQGTGILGGAMQDKMKTCRPMINYYLMYVREMKKIYLIMQARGGKQRRC